MTRTIRIAAGCIAALTATTTTYSALANEVAEPAARLAAPAASIAAQAPLPLTSHSAKAVRELDIMLMVSSLVCRNGADNFQAEYRAFSAKHISYLNAASDKMRADLVAEHGAKGAKRALDRISVRMANTFGQGHPTMNCAELKVTAAALASRQPGHGLYRSATALLEQPQQGALAIAVQ